MQFGAILFDVWIFAEDERVSKGGEVATEGNSMEAYSG